MNFMPKVYKATEILKMLLSYGFQKVSQKWSYLKLQNQTWEIVILPVHSKDIPYWTFVSILRQANLSLEESKKFLVK